MAAPVADLPVGSASEIKTPAQRLQEEHEAAESHRARVEDAIDEDDIYHPPPPFVHVHADEVGAQANGGNSGVMSAKAAGKQKARETSGLIDTQSEEAFPALGGGPKPRSPAAPTSWGGKTTLATGALNGSTPPISRPASSGASTPSSGKAVPMQSAAANVAIRQQQYGKAPVKPTIPGKYTGELEIPKAQLDKTKPIQAFLQKLHAKHGVPVTTADSNFGLSLKFIATGRKEQVVTVLNQISTDLSIKVKERVPIPASLRSHIIGRQGSNIANIQKQSGGARIQVQKLDSPLSSAADGDSSGTAIVEIEGNAVAVERAKNAILAQVEELQPRVDLRMEQVPAEYFPFISGLHGLKIQKLEQDEDLQIQIPPYHIWHHQPPRLSRPDELPVFVPHPDLHIVVSGKHAAAVRAKAVIEQIVKELQQELTLEERAFQRSQHQFIIGERGMSQLDFLEETGCAVILPPSHDDTEDVHIIGPANRLEAGIDKAMALVAAMAHDSVDVRKHLQEGLLEPDAYFQALTRYLEAKGLEEELQRLYSVQVVIPPASDRSTTLHIFSRDRTKTMQARSDLTKIIQAYPSPRLQLISVDPFFHSHLQEKCGDTLKNDLGVHMIVPPEESDPIVLVYEGNESTPAQISRQRPTGAELAVFENTLQQARNHIISHIGDQEIHTENVEVPRKFHEKVRKFVRSEQQSDQGLGQGFPVQVQFGLPQRSTSDPNQHESNGDAVSLRGPGAKNVEDFKKKIIAFLVQAEEDERQRGYITTFDFPSKFNNFLIGRQGANIKVLREKYDVEIDTKDMGKVRIRGPQKQAEACKAEIQSLAKQLEDQATYTIKVEPKFHGDLIGRNGENLRKLQSKVGDEVRIQFPRRMANDDQSIADTASEGGRSRLGANQAPDEIVIRGPRQKADLVQKELQALHKHFQENSYTAIVSVAKGQVRSLIGRGGSEMEKLRLDTGAQIDVPSFQEASDASDRVDIQVKGSKKAVDAAKAELEKRSKIFDDILTKTIDVDKKYHQALIGAGGSNISRIVKEAGGPENSAEAVKFPDRDSDSKSIRIQGTAAVVEKIIAAIQGFATEKENQVTEVVEVPVEKHRALIGRGGEGRRALEEKFNISLNIPRNGSSRAVKITGTASDVAKAKEEIARLTKEHAGETIQIPKSLHWAIAQNGRIFGRLRDKGVIVDHNGQKPPPKPDAGASTTAPLVRKSNGATPLITDEEDALQFSWEIAEPELADLAETIPWTLIGSEDNVAAAKTQIEKALESASQPKATGYLRLPDPRLHKYIIGPGGSTIKDIRSKTQCEIQVPNRRNEREQAEESITIVGAKDRCEEAKELILAAVSKGQNGNGNRPSSRV